MARILIGAFIIVLGISILTGLSLVKFAIAFIIIFIGVRMISDKGRRWDIKTSSNEDSINEVAIFSPINKTITSDNFKGGKIVMIFGGGQIDISQVKSTEKTIPLEIVAIFGGGKIIIPEGWKVNSQGTAIFGGYNSKTESGEGENILNINGAAIFGGVEIVN